MTPPIIHIAESQSFRFVPYQLPTSTRYHLPRFGESLHFDRLQEWDDKADFSQKWQRTDPWQFQVDVYGAQSIFLRLVDCTGVEYRVWTPAAVESVPGNEASLGGVRYSLTTYHFRSAFSSAGALAPGRYYLMLEIRYSDAPAKWFISEPLDIAEDQPGTLFFEYFHTRNDNDLIFRYGSINARFTLRVDGHVHELKPESEDVSYEDQRYNLQLLSSTPYRSWKLSLGLDPAISEWMLDKINRILSCSKVYIEGVAYVKADGAKWETRRVPGYPLLFASIALREADNAASALFTSTSPLTVLQRPASGYPYALHSASVGQVSLATGVVVGDIMAEAALVQQISLNPALAGTWAYDAAAGTLTYQNAPDEAYTSSAYEVLPKFFALTKRITATTRSTQVALFGFTTVVDWGEGFAGAYGDVSSQVGMQPSYTYLGSVNSLRTIRIFHKDNLHQFDSYHTQMTAIDATTQLPATLESLTIQNSFLATFNADILTPCLANLKTLNISYGSAFASVTNFNKPFVKLNSINFSYNIFSRAQVDNVFASFYAGAGVLGGGTFATFGQAPSALPTFASVTARNAMAAAGWTIITD